MTSTQLVRQLDPSHFEAIYADAAGDASRVPWADEIPCPALVNWLNAVAPSLVRCGARVAVIGCGLGEDARELVRRGYDVTAFDCSPTAIEWARRLDPNCGAAYEVADLFSTPAKWRHRFDLVVEINTIQALEPERRQDAMCAIAELVAAHGHILTICRHAPSPVGLEDGPPWALTLDELKAIAGPAGLVTDGAIAVFQDDEDPPVERMRAVFCRA